jgi:hypothetical protein
VESIPRLDQVDAALWRKVTTIRDDPEPTGAILRARD